MNAVLSIMNAAPRRLLCQLVPLAALMLGGCGGPAGRPGGHIEGPGGEVARTAHFTLRDMDGQTVRLSDYRGRVVLVNYFATWCAPCMEELPALDLLVHGPRAISDFVVLAINVDVDGGKLLRPFLDVVKIKMPILLADEGTLLGATPFGQVSAIPASFLVDTGGRHVASFAGTVPLEYLRRRVRELK